MIDFSSSIDWLSMKLTGLSVAICAITGGKVMFVLGMISVGSTIIYNCIRIYKELKNKKP